MYQENTPTPSAWSTDARQARSKLSSYKSQNLTLPCESKSRNWDIFPVFYYPLLMSLCELLSKIPVLADRSSTQCRFVLHTLVAMRSICITVTILSALGCPAILLWPLTSAGILTQRSVAHWIFFFPLGHSLMAKYIYPKQCHTEQLHRTTLDVTEFKVHAVHKN